MRGSNGQDAGIAEDDLVQAFSGWISVVSSLHVSSQSFPQGRYFLQEVQGFLLATF
jgi:hypothetical protein